MRPSNVLILCGIISFFSSFSFGKNFEEHFEKTVLPFYWQAPSGLLERGEGVQLSYKMFRHPLERGAIVFITGWTETHLKYAELIWDFYQAGYSVFSVDNRGMGFSSRLTENPQKVHVDHVDDYVKDLKVFMDEVVQPASHPRVMLVAHSMGGLIAANYLIKFPQDATAAVFSAPLFELNTGKFPERIAYRITKMEIEKGNGKEYARTQGDKTFEEASDFNKQKTTHSLERWKKTVRTWRDFPILLQGGSTNQWVNSILESTFSLLGGGWKKMPVPSLILEASDDAFVINRGHRKVCAQAETCYLRKYKKSFHELFLEDDPVRNRAVSDTLNFLGSF